MNKLDEIADLWGQELSSSKIASQLGMTKGAVCGMMFRARKAGDPRFPERPAVFGPRPRKEKPVQTSFVPDLSHLVKALPPRTRFGRVLLTDLRLHECRYPTQTLGPRGEYFFCGAPKAITSESYCEDHQKLCTTGIYVRKRAA